MFAVRNITLCTKDCMCLFICPTGATDTEDGKIDAGKCIDGCRLCVDACPSHAIYLVSERFPERALPEKNVLSGLAELLQNKAKMYIKSKIISEKGNSHTQARFFKAFGLSNQILGEDCVREAGDLIPEEKKFIDFIQSKLLQNLFKKNLQNIDEDSIEKILNEVLESLKSNRDAQKIPIYLCENCGYLSLKNPDGKCPNCASNKIKSTDE
jgi:rubrerythrin